MLLEFIFTFVVLPVACLYAHYIVRSEAREAAKHGLTLYINWPREKRAHR